MRQDKKTQSEIARAIGFTQATVSKELKRNSTSNGRYSPRMAQIFADDAKQRSHKPRKLNDRMVDFIIEKLVKYQWSPEQIKFVFNLDMIGDNNPVQYVETNSDRGFALFEQINGEKHYFKGLNRGELAGNSDHYPFAEHKVPCILFENEEGDAFKYYHTVFDTYETMKFDTYEPVFRLVRDFVERY